jgi:hypothetical protein
MSEEPIVNSLKMLLRIAFVVAASYARAADPAPVASADDLQSRGKYLVSTSGCHDCHTPWHMTEAGPKPDFTRALSGHPEGLDMPQAPHPQEPWLMTVGATNNAFAGPWGVSFAANLTPDRETGLGKWTARTFIETIRSGRHLGRGREILPPMPYPVYQNFTDRDLTAIFTYLQSIPAVRNRVPDPRPPAAPVAQAR